MSDRTYLPNIDHNRLWEIIHSRQWNQLEQEVRGQRYERLGLDRLLTIAMDMRLTFGTWSGFDILDVGCNNGLFCVGLAALGNRVVGLDSGVIAVQRLYQPLDLDRHGNPPVSSVSLRREDIRQFLAAQNRQWDIVLLLSIAHHWEQGYALSGEAAFEPDEIRRVMERLVDSCRLAMYYECPLQEPGFALGYGRSFLERYVKSPLRVSEITLTVGPNGYIRQLLRVERI